MIKRADIIDRLQTNNGNGERGDHDLNPGFIKEGELRPAAVMIGLVDRPDHFTVLLTRRTDNLEHHPGQISFPGGHIEPGDADGNAAALRETQEEIGLDPARIEIIGKLDTYLTRTGFTIEPVVAFIAPPFELSPDPTEVAEIFEVPLGHFLDPTNHHCHERTFEGKSRQFYAMPYGDYYIWGATAGMLRNLYQVLAEKGFPDV